MEEKSSRSPVGEEEPGKRAIELYGKEPNAAGGEREGIESSSKAVSTGKPQREMPSQTNARERGNEGELGDDSTYDPRPVKQKESERRQETRVKQRGRKTEGHIPKAKSQ